MMEQQNFASPRVKAAAGSVVVLPRGSKAGPGSVERSGICPLPPLSSVPAAGVYAWIVACPTLEEVYVPFWSMVPGPDRTLHSTAVTPGMPVTVKSKS